MPTGTSEIPSGSGRRWLAGGAVALVVLGLIGGMLALHHAGGAKAARVTATTPPDAVHLVVMHYHNYTTVPDSRTGCPADTKCYSTALIPASATAYDHTFTDAATAQRLQADLNAPTIKGATLPDSCKAATFDFVTYDFVFTASGQTVEHVVMRVACDAFGLRTGYPPDLTLGAERGITPGILDVLNTTYALIPPGGTGMTKLP